MPKLPQDACFRAVTALSGQGTLAKECGYLSNKCNAVMEALRSSRRAWPKRSYTALNCIDVKQPCLLQFALSKSFYSHAEGEYLEVVWVYKLSKAALPGKTTRFPLLYRQGQSSANHLCSMTVGVSPSTKFDISIENAGAPLLLLGQFPQFCTHHSIFD